MAVCMQSKRAKNVVMSVYINMYHEVLDAENDMENDLEEEMWNSLEMQSIVDGYDSDASIDETYLEFWVSKPKIDEPINFLSSVQWPELSTEFVFRSRS